ncbi:4176_t:CDS:2 [Ambispora gerdemannii]|uniref:4176_t:CDS:1 n=1 Tax=Ambispora gerdemannii TaxID=144530 RepID=A0A9N9AA46_9GLOM|nr:4176_t:CDS:2 [Ambispora gerdemannii]
MEKLSISQTALPINNSGSTSAAPKRRRNTAPAGFYSATHSIFPTHQQEEPKTRKSRFQKRLRKPPSFETYLRLREDQCDKNNNQNNHVLSKIDDNKGPDKYSINSSFSSRTINATNSIRRASYASGTRSTRLEDIKDDEPSHLGEWDLFEDETEEEEQLSIPSSDSSAS